VSDAFADGSISGERVLRPPVVVVSPHLDDAVMGCGQMLACRPGAVVLTVFAGHQPPGQSLSSWDRDSGFGPGEDPMRLRKLEDEAALQRLGARPLWLGFLDAQYRKSRPAPSLEELAEGIEAALEGAAAQTVMIPLGLGHADHRLTRRAALLVFRRRDRWAWYAYEDAIYRKQTGDPVGQAVAELVAAGVSLRPAHLVDDESIDQKRDAVDCYRSQLRALLRHRSPLHDILNPDRYWRLGWSQERGQVDTFGVSR
jgi:LmbE family N-acetylglucosaminyl deacetylase